MEQPAQLGPSWSFACPDWVGRLKAGRSLIPDLPLHQAAADKAVGIFNNLRLPDVPGQPTLGEAGGEWIRDIVRAIFGSVDPETRARRVAELMLLVPKKNSKTTNGAAISITALLMNDRPNAEHLLIGPTQEIADLAYQQAVGIINADPEGYLAKRFHTADHQKLITDRVTGARLKIKTFDLKVMTGAKPVFALVDELHIMSAYSYASRVVGQIRGGLIANPESLLIFITTQSDDAPAGVFKDELQYARSVRDGRITEHVRMLPVLYEFPEAMQVDEAKPWADPASWPMVLPNLGLSISIERLQDDFAQAKQKGEHEVRRWASQHLNIEIGLALHSARWRGADYWPSAFWAPARDDRSLRELAAMLRHCDVATGGVDGGGLDDLLGGSVIGRERRSRDWLLWSRAWAHSDVLDRRKDIAERLLGFEKDGDLVICDDPTQDIEELADIMASVDAEGLFPEVGAVGLDPAGVSAIVDAFAERGIGEGRVTGIPQGYRLTGAVWGMERKLKNGTLRHLGQPIMAWSVGNARAEQRGNATLITKEAAGRAKIDPLMSAFDAFVLMSRNPEGTGAPVDLDDFLKLPVVA